MKMLLTFRHDEMYEAASFACGWFWRKKAGERKRSIAVHSGHYACLAALLQCNAAAKTKTKTFVYGFHSLRLMHC